QSALTNSATIPHGHALGIAGGGLSADGKTLVTGGWDGTIKLWDVATNKERKSFPLLAPGLQVLAISPQGDTFATAGAEQVVRVWHMETGAAQVELRGYKS